MRHPQLWVLYPMLLTFAAHDLWDQTIPRWLCAAWAAAIAGAVWWGSGLRWWWLSALLALGAFWLAALPAGDRGAIFLCCGLMPPDLAGPVVLAAVACGFAYVEGFGRARSMIGVPFFPAVGICAIVLTQIRIHLLGPF